METDAKRPKVGVQTCIIRNGKVLLGKRINSIDSNTWNFPGGHLEFGESWEECARRETLEEAGIEIEDVRYNGAVTNDIFKKENKHYITIFVLAKYRSGEVRIMEPDKCEEWKWFKWNDLPQPLFLPIKNLLKQDFDPFKKE